MSAPCRKSFLVLAVSIVIVASVIGAALTADTIKAFVGWTLFYAAVQMLIWFVPAVAIHRRSRC